MLWLWHLSSYIFLYFHNNNFASFPSHQTESTINFAQLYLLQKSESWEFVTWEEKVAVFQWQPLRWQLWNNGHLVVQSVSWECAVINPGVLKPSLQAAY